MFNNSSMFNLTDGVGNKTINGSVPKPNFTFYDIFPPIIPREIAIAGSVIGSLFLIMGLFGNILTLTALATVKRLQTRQNCLIVSLTICDIMYNACVITMQVVTFITGEWKYIDSIGMCWFLNISLMFWGSQSALHIPCIALHRLFIVVYPSHVGKIDVLSKKFIGICIVVTYLSSILVQLTPRLVLLATGEESRQSIFFLGKIMNCVLPNLTSIGNIMIVAVTLLVCCLVPYCYCRILYVTKQARKRLQLHNAQLMLQLKRKEQELRIVQSLVITFVIFLLGAFCLPCLMFLDPKLELPHICYFCCTVLQWCGRTTNWLIYGLMNPDFLEAYKKLLRRDRVTVGSVQQSGTGNNGNGSIPNTNAVNLLSVTWHS